MFVLSGRVFESRFCPHIFDQLGKWLDQKDKVHFKMTSFTRKLIITLRISPNISRSKGYQINHYDQLIEYNMTNVFIKI